MNPIRTLLCVCTAFLAIAVPSRADDNPIRLKTVVIDPGHGGHDAGCISRDKKTYEKNLALDIAKRFAGKIRKSFPDVNVIMTRDDDTYVTLSGRADIANDNHADLFISIHIDAQAGGTNANGFSIHCLGQSSKPGNDLYEKNLDLCKRENSVILLEEDYSTKYQGFDPSDVQSYIFFSLMQNSNLERSLAFADNVLKAMKKGPIVHNRGVWQSPLWVLWRTTMPAVLVECGFISNPQDLAVLRSEKGRDRIAENLLNAFSAYKSRSDSASPSTKSQENLPQSDEQTKALPSSSVMYGTQVLATGRKMAADDPFFKGYEPISVKGPSLYKYVLGSSSDEMEARKIFNDIHKKFPDSFLVRIEGEKVTRIK